MQSIEPAHGNWLACCWLQAQAADKCAAQLKLARAATADSKAAADAAAASAAEASKAARDAKGSPELAACAAAQALATAAAQKAAQSGIVFKNCQSCFQE